MKTLTLFNGNNKRIEKSFPKIIIQANNINNEALNHIEENTNLHFKKHNNFYECQPFEASQYIRLFLTYNFKTRYFDNWNYKNTLILKFDKHVGFDVNSICFECAKHNHINTHGLEVKDRLSC